MDAAELERLLSYRRVLDEIARVPAPRARIFAPPQARLRSVAVLPGAFDPPTRAHLALAQRALAQGMDAVLLSLGSATVDKQETGLLFEDRLLLLSVLTEKKTRFGVVVHNRGLYADQAEALNTALPETSDLAFVLGMDKLSRIFEARYYPQIDVALTGLFRRARLLVAPRGDLDEEAFRATLAAPLARRFADRISFLPLEDEWRGLSSAAIRERCRRGEGTSDSLPPEVEEFLRRTAAYRAPERYAERAAEVRAGW